MHGPVSFVRSRLLCCSPAFVAAWFGWILAGLTIEFNLWLSAAGTMDTESVRKWIVEHKLRAVGTLWASALLGSFAYNFSQPGMKTSVKLIHARLHAQALTLAALAGSALVEAYDHQSGEKAKRYEKHIQT